MNGPFSLSALDPPSARLCLEVEKYSAQQLSPLKGRKFVLALSGGADSTALACIFAFLAPRAQLSLRGMYINHKIRPEAMREAIFVEKLCGRLGMPFMYEEFDAPQLARDCGTGLEEAGRKGRYALLELGREYTRSDNILVAHHSGDLSEDILLRLIRGSGWPALGGMRSRKGFVFRPLLHIERHRLLNFLRYLNQGWCEDLSNQDLSYRRNRLRARFLPFLKEENPSIERSFRNLHQLSLADEEFWQDYLAELLKEHPPRAISDSFGQGLELPLSAVLGQALAVRLRLYHHIIRKVSEAAAPGLARPQAQFEKLMALDKAARARRSGKIFQFQGALLVRLNRSGIAFLLQHRP